MDELASAPNQQPKRDPVKRDTAALRGLCASLNAGFTAPGGATPAVQKEINEAMRGTAQISDRAFKQATPRTRTDIRPQESETIMGTPMPTSEARAETMVYREDNTVPTCGCDTTTESQCCEATDEEVVSLEVPLDALPQDDRPPTDADYPATDLTINPKYRKVLFTGQMKSGKDYVALAAGFQILSFAAPLYALLDYFFGVTEQTKDSPGARSFMQLVGTWGRGDISQSEPISPERAVFTRMIIALGQAGVLPMGDTVDWSSFGKDRDIWLKACLKRADVILRDPEAKVAVVNGRFKNEIEAFDAAGWTRFHVMASELALKQRREKDRVPSSTLQHSSEELARALDKSSIAVAQRTKKPKINVVWNDPSAGRISSKFYTLKEFCVTVTQRV